MMDGKKHLSQNTNTKKSAVIPRRSQYYKNLVHFREIGELAALLAVTVAVLLVAVAPARIAVMASTIAATSAVTIAATVAIAVSTTATLRLLILVALGLREQRTVREAVLAGLLVDLDELHLDLVAHAEHLVHVLDAAVGDMRR